MEETEPIESINKQLRNMFGIDSMTGRTMFRVVWSEEQFEMRMTDRTETGIQLLTPVLKELPKYRQWITEKYVLERLVIVPEPDRKELPTSILSYEPVWVFKSKDDTYVPPTFWACKFVIDTLYAALGKQSMAKYVDEESKHPQEVKEKRINKLTEELFGDESFLLGRTITGEATTVPQSYETVQKETV
jgi:hypothetical protein